MDFYFVDSWQSPVILQLGSHNLPRLLQKFTVLQPVYHQLYTAVFVVRIQQSYTRQSAQRS